MFSKRIFDLLRVWIQRSARTLVANVSEGQETAYQLLDLHRTALLSQEQGKLEEAKVFYERALLRKETVYGRNHPSTLDTVNNLRDCSPGYGQPPSSEGVLRSRTAGEGDCLWS